MDDRLKQVILSAMEGLDVCAMYNKCDGKCEGCFFDEGFDLVSQLNGETRKIESGSEKPSHNKQRVSCKLCGGTGKMDENQIKVARSNGFDI